ncbi:BSD domain [Dillenia turbinata]|uniref:BSD domain n=1 Tax=Dillenia turbinata TaxID=194707 RepID=A0AAN8V0F5_9MAGN
MDLWQRARSFAEEAAKKSQELTMEAAKKSQEFSLSIGSSKFSDIVSETAKKSKEFAVEASRKADQLKIEALKRAEEIRSQIPASALSSLVDTSIPLSTTTDNSENLEDFGITDDLREFVKGITMNTFRDFPLEDDTEIFEAPTVSNIRQDLTAWQEKHANLVLKTVKEISKLRYELCPRIMRERKFWRIYFILVNTHVAPYEKQYMENLKLKSAEQTNDEKAKGTIEAGTSSKPDGKNASQQIKTSKSAEEDLDVFLLGDMGDSDEGPGMLAVNLTCVVDYFSSYNNDPLLLFSSFDMYVLAPCRHDHGDGDFDDDFDKMESSAVLGLRTELRISMSF